MFSYMYIHVYFHFHLQLLGSLQILLTLPSPLPHPHLLATHQQIASAIADLLQSQAGAVRSQQDWLMVVFLLESVGIGASTSATMLTWSPFSEMKTVSAITSSDSHHNTDKADVPTMQISSKTNFLEALDTFDLLVEESIEPHAPEIFFKCCKTLSDLVRSDVYVTSTNFSLCIHCIRTFSEVSSCRLALEHEANMGK